MSPKPENQAMEEEAGGSPHAEIGKSITG